MPFRKLGIVVSNQFDIHFRDIADCLSGKYEISPLKVRSWPFSIMKERANRRITGHDLQSFMRAQDVTFFEWAEQHFVVATHLPKTSKIIVRVHLHELWDFAPQADWSKVDQVIFVSHAMERKFLERFPFMQARTSVVHNGVRLDRFQFLPRPYRGVIGTLSRIEPHKRIDGLIIALHELRRRGHDLTLRIGGTCNEPRYQRYADEIHRLVNRLDLEEHVIFDGFVDDTPAWFQGIDIFVTNSISEGLQVALLEAMASGCYCLSHNWDGADEALPVANRYFTEQDLVTKISSFDALDAESKQDAGKEMRQIAEERFDIHVRKLDVVRIVDTVAGSTPQGFGLEQAVSNA